MVRDTIEVGFVSRRRYSGTHHLIWIAVKTPGKVGPNANGSAGRDDIKLVLPSQER